MDGMQVIRSINDDDDARINKISIDGSYIADRLMCVCIVHTNKMQ